MRSKFLVTLNKEFVAPNGKKYLAAFGPVERTRNGNTYIIGEDNNSLTIKGEHVYSIVSTASVDATKDTIYSFDNV